MAIANVKPSAVPAPVPVTQIEPEGYKSLVYDHRNTPLHSLIAYVDGAPWTVNYFRQSLGSSNDVKEVDPALSSVYQQYEYIKNLEIRVDSPLSSSQDPATQVITVQGTGLIYPFMVPNVNDYFVSDTMDSKIALFRITQVDRKTFVRDSVHAITYVMVNYIDQVPDIWVSLQDKIVKTFYFSKDRLVEGLAPMLTSDRYQDMRDLKSAYKNIVSYYFQTFFEKRAGTIIVPGQDNRVYDHFLTNYLLEHVNVFDAPELMRIKRLTSDDDVYMEQPQFWTMLDKRDGSLRQWCNQEMSLVAPTQFDGNTFFKNLARACMDFIIYPKHPDLSKDSTAYIGPQPESGFGLIPTTNRQQTILDALARQYTFGTKLVQSYHDVLIDSAYVLSWHFYNNDSQMSLLEILVRDYLELKSLDVKALLHLVNLFPKMERLEQYYYGPILITLLRVAEIEVY